MADPSSIAVPEHSSSHGELAVRPWLAVWTLGYRELQRFFRQRNRVIGAIGQPILFWLLFGSGMHQTFRMGTAGDGASSFQAYFFPGTLMLILLFTAIFTTISIIEDRKEGFLQSVLVAPVPRWAMVLGKVLGGSVIALIQGLIFLLLALTLPIEMHWNAVGGLVLLMFVSAVALTSMGFVLAWRMQSTQGFHAIMNLLLMPMWLLSGAFFPQPVLDANSSWGQVVMHWMMKLNPVTYCVAGVRQLLFDPQALQGLELPSELLCWGVTVSFAVIMLAWSWRIAGKTTSGDLL